MASFNWPASGGSGNGVPVYPTIGSFPAGSSSGDLAVAADTGILYEWNGSAWVAIAGPGAVLSIGYPANGLNITADVLTIALASGSLTGALSSSDWTTFNNKQNALTIGNLTDAGTDGITVTGGTGAVIGSGTSISQHVADTTHNGYLSSTDWNTFNGKQAALTIGNLTDAGTDGITVTGGTGAVIGSGTSISQHVADTTHNGYLSSTDWNTFNGKQASGNYITALTGDGTASGPGSVALTLATVNSNTGSFGSSTAIPSFTVNGKGLITAASTNAVVAPAGTLTGTTLASNVVTSSLTSVGTITSGTWTGTTIAIANGGTGQTSANAAFNALSPMTTQGDIIYGGASGAGTRLAAGSANQALTFLGSQTSPSWNTLYQENVPNYINANPNAEVDTTGWATYANTAANIPSTGTGGTATNLTFSRSTSSPLRGTGSFSMVQANSTSLQGKGVSYDFTIDSADQTQVLTIKFDYNASSTFVASNGTTAPLNDGTTSTNAGNSDIEVFIYDKTNSVLIPVSPQTIVGNGSNNFTFQGSFQASSNSTSYRLIFHVATTSANATGWTFKFDNVSVRPNTYNMGAAVTAWAAYSPTLSAGFGTTTNASFFYRRVGDSVEVMGSFTAGTVAASLATITLPSGLSLDTTKISLANTTSNSGPTMGDYWNTEASGFGSIVTATGTSSSLLYFGNLSANSTNTIPQNGNTILTSSTNVSLKFRVPVSGWGVTQALSSDTDTRVVACEGALQTPTGTLTSSYNVVKFPTATKDTHAGYSASSGLYTVPVSGFYQVNAVVAITCASSSAFTWLQVFQNGSNAIQGSSNYIGSSSQCQPTVSGVLYCTAGDTIGIYINTNVSTPVYASTLSTFGIYRLSGPAQVAASESVNCRYYGATASLSGSDSLVTYSTKDYDSHGAYSAGVYTCPTSGKYLVIARLTTTDASGAFAPLLSIYKNNVQVTQSSIGINNTAASNAYNQIMDQLNCLAGDTIKIEANSNGTTPSVVSSTIANVLSIARVGN